MRFVLATLIVCGFTATASADVNSKIAAYQRTIVTSYSGLVTCKGNGVQYQINPPAGRVTEFFYYQHDPRRLWVGAQGGWSYVLGNDVSCQIEGTETSRGQ